MKGNFTEYINVTLNGSQLHCHCRNSGQLNFLHLKDTVGT